MKKVFAILLALSLVCAFAACNRNNTPDPTDPTDLIEDTTPVIADISETEPVSETEPTTEPVSETETTAEPTTEAAKTPDKMSTPELVDYFNQCANRVRNEKPAFTYELTNTILNPKTQGGVGSLISPIVRSLIEKKMPGTTDVYPMKKGENNTENFLSLNAAASSLKAGDVTSIQAVKSGQGYVITVKLGNAVNPANGGGSAYSRLFEIRTPQQTLDAITEENSAVTGDVNNVKLEYHSGNVALTVDAEGRVTGLTGGYDLKAIATDVKIIGFTTTFTCDQTSRIVAKGFTW